MATLMLREAALKPELADSQGIIGFASLGKLYFLHVPSLSSRQNCNRGSHQTYKETGKNDVGSLEHTQTQGQSRLTLPDGPGN